MIETLLCVSAPLRENQIGLFDRVSLRLSWLVYGEECLC
jgi:hypothetical protein